MEKGKITGKGGAFRLHSPLWKTREFSTSLAEGTLFHRKVFLFHGKLWKPFSENPQILREEEEGTGRGFFLLSAGR